MTLSIGDNAPDFTLLTDNGGSFTLSNHRGQKVVVYFYPKDDTSGCTAQACDFRDSLNRLKSANVAIVGISKDTVSSHEKFKEKYGLNFPLASDAESNTCEKYGVWVEKSMYGRNYMGIARTTFLIDEHGVVEYVWRNVSVPGHIDEVLSALGGKMPTANTNVPTKAANKSVKKGAAKKPAAKKASAKPLKATKKTARKPVKKAAKKAQKKIVKKAPKKAAKKMVKKSAKKPMKKIAKKAAKKTVRKGKRRAA